MIQLQLSHQTQHTCQPGSVCTHVCMCLQDHFLNATRKNFPVTSVLSQEEQENTVKLYEPVLPNVLFPNLHVSRRRFSPSTKGNKQPDAIVKVTIVNGFPVSININSVSLSVLKFLYFLTLKYTLQNEGLASQ